MALLWLKNLYWGRGATYSGLPKGFKFGNYIGSFFFYLDVEGLTIGVQDIYGSIDEEAGEFETRIPYKIVKDFIDPRYLETMKAPSRDSQSN